MKLARLFLKAYGPFTDRVLDFSGTRATLHLVYGPNEAGKSSALRAIGDLRFGIPPRSADSFLHPYERMRVGAAFVEADGTLLGLMRRKGRSDTLVRCCPHTGEPWPQEPLLPSHEAALTARLARGEFEAMFGLDHAQLRRGGRELIEGRGELGAALFEASAGTQGVAALLESLDAEAKRLYSPRATHATINEARRQMDEARQACKAALTRPADWKSLHRAHEEARAAREAAEQALAARRARAAELAELRSVAPLVREQAALEEAIEALADAPELRPDAIAQRQRAEEGLGEAQAELDAAGQELQAALAALGRLPAQDPVLAHAAMVERLLAAHEAVERDRPELQQLQARLAQTQQELEHRAARIAPGLPLAALLDAVPSEADGVALQQQASALNELGARLQLLREGLARLDEQQRAADAQRPPAPEPLRQRQLGEALDGARALGDVPARFADAQRLGARQTERLARALHELGLADPAALERLRPLLDAQIDAAAREREEAAAAARTLHEERRTLHTHLDAQRLRLGTLQAAGELATPAALREARRRRDEIWHRVREACVTRSTRAETLARDDAPHLPLPAAFEAALAEADRLADLLQRDAERATKVEECGVRIAQMQARLAEIDAELASLAQREAARQEPWTGLLRAQALPLLEPAALKQWQLRCEAVRELAAQAAEAERALAALREAAGRARAGLCAALGEPGDDRPDELAWPALLARAARRHQTLQEAQLEEARFELAQRQRHRERTALEEALAQAAAALRTREEALAGWLRRLLLPPGCGAAVVQARLQELNALAALHDEGGRHRVRRDTLLAQDGELRRRTGELAALLGGPAPAVAEDFTDRLAARLAAARTAAQQRALAQQQRETQETVLARAHANLARHRETLQRLCDEAGGVSLAELAGAQARAQRKAQARTELETLRRRIAQASSRPARELRERIGSLDVAALEAERLGCEETVREGEQDLANLRERERAARAALEAVDTSDAAAVQREALEQAAARLRGALQPWARLRLASALLHEALRRFREKAQGPMLREASHHFRQMTGGRYTRLVTEDGEEKMPRLLAEREDGRRIALDAMSEGTADQLYLALRLAALTVQAARPGGEAPAMPLVLDDVLMTSDDGRALQVLCALLAFSAGGQVLLFTHHRHLHELAAAAFAPDEVGLHRL